MNNRGGCFFPHCELCFAGRLAAVRGGSVERTASLSGYITPGVRTSAGSVCNRKRMYPYVTCPCAGACVGRDRVGGFAPAQPRLRRREGLLAKLTGCARGIDDGPQTNLKLSWRLRACARII